MPFPNSIFAQQGRFSDIQPIAQGASGQVYHAKDNLGRAVAVKEALPTSQAFQSVIARFEKESQIQAALNDPHIILAYHLEVDPQTQERYLICEYANGGSLADHLRVHGTLTEQQAIKVALDICAALETTWSQQIVHRDVKPYNILLNKDAQGLIIAAKLSDFGVAQDQRLRTTTALPGTNHPGTPLYMAPEQGNIMNILDVRADIYALGITLFEMLTLKDYKLLEAQPGGPPSLRDFNPLASPGIAAVIQRAVQPDPRQRYQTPQDMAGDLHAVLAGNQPPLAAPWPLAASARASGAARQTFSFKRALAMVGGVVIVIVGLAQLFQGSLSNANTLPTTAPTALPAAVATATPTAGAASAPTALPEPTAAASPTPAPSAEPRAVGAAAGGLLKKVQDRGMLICGVNGELPGFSHYDSQTATWSGFDVDFCRVVAAAIFGDPARVEFRKTSAGERFKAIRTGEVDVLFRNTTWTSDRDIAEGLDFGPTTFHDGQGIMVPKSARVRRLEDLVGKTICVEAKTTSESNLEDTFKDRNIPFTPLKSETLNQNYDNYESGRCDAVTSDQSQLTAQRTTLKDPDAHVILDELFSREPLGPAFAENDSQWRDVVSWAVFATIYAEELGVNQSNVEELRRATTDTRVRRLLGLEGTTGPGLGLPNDFAFKIILKVGNYADIYDRNLGPNTPFALDRGPNKAWNNGQGGVLSSPPFQ